MHKLRPSSHPYHHLEKRWLRSRNYFRTREWMKAGAAAPACKVSRDTWGSIFQSRRHLAKIRTGRRKKKKISEISQYRSFGCKYSRKRPWTVTNCHILNQIRFPTGLWDPALYLFLHRSNICVSILQRRLTRNEQAKPTPLFSGSGGPIDSKISQLKLQGARSLSDTHKGHCSDLLGKNLNYSRDLLGDPSLFLFLFATERKRCTGQAQPQHFNLHRPPKVGFLQVTQKHLLHPQSTSGNTEPHAEMTSDEQRRVSCKKTKFWHKTNLFQHTNTCTCTTTTFFCRLQKTPLGAGTVS